jgi:hypothetical protein
MSLIYRLQAPEIPSMAGFTFPPPTISIRMENYLTTTFLHR